MSWSVEHEEYLKLIYDYTEELIEIYHKSYNFGKKALCYYKLPVLVISSVSGYLSIGNSGYFSEEQSKYISLAVGLMNLIVAVINSIEAFKGINNRMIVNSKTYYLLNRLHDDISLILSLPIDERRESGVECVLKYYEKLEIILEGSIIPKKLPKNLLQIKKLITQGNQEV